jgi:plasmid stabilization system protein ParE
MTFRVVITDRALDDLRAIRDFIARDSVDRAAEFLEKLLRGLDALEQFPQGFPLAIENELVPYELRQWPFGQYRVLYRVTGQRVEILHVRHGARLPATGEELTE